MPSRVVTVHEPHVPLEMIRQCADIEELPPRPQRNSQNAKHQTE